MKYIFYILLLGVLAAIAIPRISDITTSSNSQIQQEIIKESIPPLKYKKEVEKIENKILKKVRKEKKVIASNWMIKDGNLPTLSVAVMDNKTNRDGFAQYICLLIIEAGLTNKKYNFSAIKVNITDAKKAINQGNFVKLGEAFCKAQD